MKSYKGYYIDGFWFKNEAEIDKWLLDKAVAEYKDMVKYFSKHCSMEVSVHLDNLADRLHTNFGLEYDEIEIIEISAYC